MQQHEEPKYLEPGDLVWIEPEESYERDQLAVVLDNDGELHTCDHLPNDKYGVFYIEDGNEVSWRTRAEMTFIQHLGFSFTRKLFQYRAQGNENYKELLRAENVSEKWLSRPCCYVDRTPPGFGFADDFKKMLFEWAQEVSKGIEGLLETPNERSVGNEYNG